MPRECLVIVSMIKGVLVLLKHTTASLWQLSQSQQSVVTRNRLECDIGMPSFLATLLLVCLVEEPVAVYLLCLLGRDDTDLIVFPTKLSAGVGNRMDMKLRRRWLARELTKALHKFFLEIVCDIILLAEENNTSLGD